ncbi:MAG: RHS repeat-associated core domain-containing protein [Alphaproteobacteria bacterium]|nr:MAG: RHS repeat-associated core domain-containing protein [Alphaproteobacteria bacterium]
MHYDQGANGKGRLTGAQYAAGSTTYAYDSQGHLSQESQIVDKVTLTTTYTRNAAGQVVRAVLPSGKVLNYAYNANGQVAQISLNGAALITGITYQAFGPASGWSALGQAHRRSFNLDGHVTGITTPDLNITMGYDQAERLSTLQEGKLGLQRFGYAGNGWLDRYTFTDGITGRYDFDPSGNRTAQRDGVKGTVTSVIAGNSNQVTSVTKNNGKTVPMRHDLAGNLTFDGVQDVELSYDGANRTSGVKNKGTQYRYNHADQRVEKLGPGTRGVGKEIYAYDLSGLMGGVYGPDAKPLWETVRLDGAPVAVLGGDGKAYAAHPDYRGAPIRLNGANGAMVWDWQASGPWADVSPLHYTPGLSAAFPFHYRERLPGQFYDDETDMNYNGARIYNMHLGRFNQPDPVLQLDGLNSYNIDNNNPVGFVDPDGRTADPIGYGASMTGSRAEQAYREAAQAYTQPQTETSWGEVAAQGFGTGVMAAADGMNPFGNPFYDAGAYSDSDPGAEGAYFIGQRTVDVGLALLLRNQYNLGREICIGKNLRIAPFGNRTGHPLGELPHYHRRGAPDINGETPKGQGIKRHRPWERKSSDTNFMNRL